jgi:hypothetical protein
MVPSRSLLLDRSRSRISSTRSSPRPNSRMLSPVLIQSINRDSKSCGLLLAACNPRCSILRECRVGLCMCTLSWHGVRCVPLCHAGLYVCPCSLSGILPLLCASGHWEQRQAAGISIIGGSTGEERYNEAVDMSTAVANLLPRCHGSTIAATLITQ